MNVPLLDLKAQYRTIKPEIDRAVAAVFESQYFINGPEVKQCEDALAKYCGVTHAVGVSSGTDALLIVLMAEGIGPGDEVITTDYSFFASAGCISRTGAKPVLVDIDPVSFNIAPTQIESRITPRTKAIMPVHLYGQPADMDAIMAIAKRHNLLVIEDAAQAIGTEYHGQRVGSIGDYGCFSFFPSKNLGGAGDGGIVTMNDAAKAEKLRIFRNHGMHVKYHHKWVGGNFRLDTLQAAVILAKLPHLDGWSDGRKANADRYRRLFKEAGLTGKVKLPVEAPHVRHIYNQFIIRVEKRDALQAFMKDKGIGTEIYYPVPFHAQECFADLKENPERFPHSRRAAAETLALPIYSELSDEQAEYVVQSISEFYR